jgi:hypothetical protein
MSLETRDPVPAASVGTAPSPVRPPTAPLVQAPNRGATARAIFLGLAFIPINCYWVSLVEGVWHGLHFTCLSLAMNVVFLLLLLLIGNAALARWRPRSVFAQGELMTVFSMLALASVLCGHDRMASLMGIICHAPRYATPENHWRDLFIRYLPDPLIVKDPDAIFQYYTGGSSYFSTGYWRLWVRPALYWSSFWGALVWMMFCLTVILRRRWTESERLSYPIIQIPLAMTDPKSGFFRNRLMWIGFALAAGLDVMNGLNYLYPAVPSLTYKGDPMDVAPLFTERPWSAIDSLRLDFYPFMIGLGFLLPQDLIFSSWFFYLFGRAQLVIGAMIGIDQIAPDYPYHGMQAAGGVVVLGLMALWEARSYLRQVGRRVLGRPSELTDDREAMSYRTAVIGLVAGMLWVALFARWVGMAPVLIAPYFLVFFLVALTVARLRADTGIPGHGLYMVNPQDILITHLGTQGMSAHNLSTLGLFEWFNRFNRAHPMPVGLETQKVGQVLRLEQRRLMAALLVTIVVSLFCAFAIFPALMYHNGGALAAEVMGAGWDSYDSIASWLQSPKKPDPLGMGFFGGGGLLALGLALMRSRFAWWPLHPMGYPLGIGGTMDRWWFAMLIATVLKGTITHYGGVRGYRQAAPFFMGLVLGQYVVACFWSIVACVLNEPMYWSWQA